MAREPHEHFQALQMMPPGEYELAYWSVQDGEFEVWREPLLGWALGKSWLCPQWDCEGTRCIDRDAHREMSREVKPMVLVEGTVDIGDLLSYNGSVISARLTDEELRVFGQRMRAENEELLAERTARADAEARRP